MTTTTRKITVMREDGERRALEIVAKADGTVWLWDSVADPNSDSLVQLQDDSDTSVADALGPDWEICGPEIRVITVYWDDDANAWAYRTTLADGSVERGTVDVAPEASIADAIDQACYQIDVFLTHDDFAIYDMLCADWAAEVPA